MRRFARVRGALRLTFEALLLHCRPNAIASALMFDPAKPLQSGPGVGSGRRAQTARQPAYPSRGVPHDAELRSGCVCEPPPYPASAMASVAAALASLPSGKVWFTYRDVEAAFGISRATIIRRLRDGCVPGVRIVHGRLLPDGAVRRLDRDQLGWLLLATRFSGLR